MDRTLDLKHQEHVDYRRCLLWGLSAEKCFHDLVAVSFERVCDYQSLLYSSFKPLIESPRLQQEYSECVLRAQKHGVLFVRVRDNTERDLRVVLPLYPLKGLTFVVSGLDWCVVLSGEHTLEEAIDRIYKVDPYVQEVEKSKWEIFNVYR